MNREEPRPAGELKMPRGLTPAARRHWKRLAAILKPIGLLTAGDADAFRSLVETLSIIDKCRVELSRSGLVVVIRGKPSTNPFLGVLRDAEAQAIRLFTEFGLTPSSRTRLYTAAVPPSPTTMDYPDIADSYFSDSPTLQ